jgi:hypothetical protein
VPISILRPDGFVMEIDHQLARPRRVLAGARIGVLDNMKPNAGLLMTYVAERLAERAGGPPPLVLRKNAAQPAPEEVIGELVKEADLVLTGSAD